MPLVLALTRAVTSPRTPVPANSCSRQGSHSRQLRPTEAVVGAHLALEGRAPDGYHLTAVATDMATRAVGRAHHDSVARSEAAGTPFNAGAHGLLGDVAVLGSVLWSPTLHAKPQRLAVHTQQEHRF